jgi:hypothetical protein
MPAVISSIWSMSVSDEMMINDETYWIEHNLWKPIVTIQHVLSCLGPTRQTTKWWKHVSSLDNRELTGHGDFCCEQQQLWPSLTKRHGLVESCIHPNDSCAWLNVSLWFPENIHSKGCREVSFCPCECTGTLHQHLSCYGCTLLSQDFEVEIGKCLWQWNATT